jgi:hypothetical protein
MIKLRLYGGLGNQLFQLSTALLFYEYGEIIYVDDSSLSKYATSRKNELRELFEIPHYVEFKRQYLTDLRIPRFIHNSYLISDKNELEVLDSRGQLLILDGYFQHSGKEIFREKVKVLSLMLYPLNCNAINLCVIHIRGDDFLTTNSPVLHKKYYLDAIFKMQSTGINEFIVITDDRRYSDSILKNSNANFKYSNGSAVEDFKLLICAEHKILSNSTFSLWGYAISKQLGHKGTIEYDDLYFQEYL